MHLTASPRRRPTVRTALGVLALATPLALAGCASDDAASDEQATGGTTSAAQSEGRESGGDVECPPAEGTDERTTSFDSAPPMCLTPGVDYSAVITTDAGTVTVDLLEEKAPETVNNFVFLARHNYYDGITFHRVIPGFMIQGGDPQGTGSGGPGYEFADELPASGEYEIGSVAMANAGPDTNGSQFFIVTGDSGVSLPPDYSLFGTVTEGMEAVTAIESDGSPQGRPQTTHTIESVEIVEG
ncbi:peptidylprolyl isomerase [Dietzia cinnamea]|uniref:Peptidyl-prolyl cis-trans isomerase n=2 Tax=Dietzia TaxID=37914 RepID=A0A4R3ZTY1_9ACTN|nr:peptidylprolyl isomerase [Dietzia cinnamea]KZO59761.1 peptidylprolyl isomerase [Dietzia maris]MBM7232043.1 peptidylprolyl isomerase [Dietzia cinnamea]PWD95757.1 peptidylprolyl isomerase [Dietzia maris]TCW23851.1 peptidylprolyl isomerase [Dietzia cinnamea]